MNFFDKDSQGRDFLEYAFLVENMGLLETESIEGLIYDMWDLERHTMQTITQFMRLNFMFDDLRHFSMQVFTRKYEMPIEDNDSFSMEFRYTSNSVYLRVLCEIIWTLLAVVIEFIFSLELVAIYQGNKFNDGWLTEYFLDRGWAAYFHVFIRLSYIISLLLKSILLKSQNNRGLSHQNYY